MSPEMDQTDNEGRDLLPPIPISSPEDIFLPPAVQALINKLTAENEEKTLNIVTHQRRIAEVTVKELRDAITFNPTHPKSVEFAAATGGMVGSKTVWVEQVDLQAILQKMNVEVREEVVNGEKISTKHLV